ncbi:MAG TPA: hypothetical protein VH641_12335 [Streptosporangiaceae bacterium]
MLAAGAELVDTPGTGSVYAHNTAQALALAEGLCWQSLTRGDTAGFARQAAAAAQLRQFGVCARLLPDH